MMFHHRLAVLTAKMDEVRDAGLMVLRDIDGVLLMMMMLLLMSIMLLLMLMMLLLVFFLCCFQKP